MATEQHTWKVYRHGMQYFLLDATVSVLYLVMHIHTLPDMVVLDVRNMDTMQLGQIEYDRSHAIVRRLGISEGRQP